MTHSVFGPQSCLLPGAPVPLGVCVRAHTCAQRHALGALIYTVHISGACVHALHTRTHVHTPVHTHAFILPARSEALEGAPPAEPQPTLTSAAPSVPSECSSPVVEQNCGCSLRNGLPGRGNTGETPSSVSYSSGTWKGKSLHSQRAARPRQLNKNAQPGGRKRKRALVGLRETRILETTLLYWKNSKQ